jgi:hypothetical protein
MSEFYTVELDRREKILRAIGYVAVTLIFAVVVTLASGIL